jgi:nucleotide-binding universal stress UspA family protein
MSRIDRSAAEEVMMKFRRILAPTDFSPLSERGVAEAASLARAVGAELVLLHVVEPAVMAGDLYGASAMATVIEELQASARLALARAVAKMKKRRQRCRGVLANGGAATTIVDTAARLRADLIVLATHGRSGFSHLLLGSVAERVVRGAACAVLTVPSKQPRERRRRARKR